jgi:hypothetical protein
MAGIVLYNLFSMINANWRPPTNNHITCVAKVHRFITIITLITVIYHLSIITDFFFLPFVFYFFIHDVYTPA